MSSHTRRSSLLVQAGDALNLWRRRPSIRQPPPPPTPPFAFDHVIDIAPDEELEERQRLRDAAAHSIGLGPLLEPTEEEETPEEQEQHRQVVVLPPFPASPATLAPFVVLQATIPKYYPPSSLRIFALAKQWKPRYLLLSVPAGSVSHLHLFKGSNPDDRELERLEINADSVVFVAESLGTVSTDPDVPAHVVKVAGADVGARRKDWNSTDDVGRTVWLLHLSTSSDAQRWISAIKSAIFEQRTQRAGLGPSSTTPPSATANEPRGDMDVMLSMRLHASHTRQSHSPTSPSNTSVSLISPTNSPSPTSPHPVPSPTTARPVIPPPLPPTPTSPTAPQGQAGQGYAASLAPSIAPSSRSVRSVATAPAPSSPSSNPFSPKFSFSSTSSKNSATARSQPGTVRPDSSGSGTGSSSGGKAVAALKGLFDRRPRSSSAASVTSVASGRSARSGASFVQGPTTDESVRLGDSFARMGSLLARSNSTATANANGNDNGKRELERRIVGTRDELTNGNVNGNGHTQSASEGSSGVDANTGTVKRRTFSMGISMSMGGSSGGGGQVTPLQPPPRRKRWTAISDASASSSSFGRIDGDGERPSSTHPYANGNGNASGVSYYSSFAPLVNGNAKGRPGSAGGRPGSAGGRPGSAGGRPGSAGGRPGSAGGWSVGGGGGSASPSTPLGMYAHPHANGSAGTAGSFGVPSVRRTSVRDGSFVREGSLWEEKEGSVRTAGSASVRTQEGRQSVHVDGDADGRSEHSVSTGTGHTGGRSRASSVGNGNGNGTSVTVGPAMNGNANGSLHGEGANGKSRRWSTLPRRLTPPASPPPAAPATIPHPYAAAALSPSSSDRPPSRSSVGSAGKGSRSSFGSASKSWARSGKRASGISIMSGVSIGSVGEKRVSSGSGGSVAGALTAASLAPPPLQAAPTAPPTSRPGNRLSVPPPPRPAPTSALPPAPGESGSPNGRTSFSSSARDSRTSLHSVRESTAPPRSSANPNRESRASLLSVSFRDPPPPIASSKSAPLPAPAAHSKGGSFRESMSMGHRALRLSTLMAPKPPPVGVLPPRPDEVALAPPSQQQQSDHRRNGSSSSQRNSAILGRVRASTSESGAGSLHMVPSSPSFPPPRGPLPAPPVAAPTPVRHASLKLKQRLRILSAPPAPHPAAHPQPQQYSSQHSTPAPRSRPTSLDATSPPPRPARSRARPGPMTLATFLSASTPSTPTTAAPVPLSPTAFYASTPPATPIGEKIIEFRTQNDPSFLELSTGSTPVIPSRPLPALSGPGAGVDPPAPENEYAEIVSLPPPRRSSRQISIKDVERAPTPPPDPAAVPLPPDAEDEGGPAKLFSLSRNGSAVSLGIVTM